MRKIYLDNCALNRPFDDQGQERIRLETEAIMLILSRVERKELALIGSDVLEIEIDLSPDPGQRSRLIRISEYIQKSVVIGKKEEERAREFMELGFAGFDAFHLACAESGKVEVFLTTDDRLLKAAKRNRDRLLIKVENPLEWIKEILC